MEKGLKIFLRASPFSKMLLDALYGEGRKILITTSLSNIIFTNFYTAIINY